VYNNTVVLEHSISWAIEYRFASTQNVSLINNLTNKAIRARNGATGKVENNRTSAARDWFVNAAAGDLHLAPSASRAIDAGRSVPGLVDDFDGQQRPAGATIDVGADEHLRPE
jgi:hypothetical protein